MTPISRPRFLPHALALAASLLLAPLAHAERPTGLDFKGMDPQVRVQDRLFDAMNGGWFKATQIPADKAEYGTFVQISDVADARVKAIIEQLQAQPQQAGTTGQKVADFHRAFIHEAQLDQLGLSPVKGLLDQVDQLGSRDAVLAFMGREHPYTSLPLAWSVQPGVKTPDRYVLGSWQAGLGLPDRDYYLQKDARMAQIRAAYRDYLALLLTQAGDTQAQAHAEQVLTLETAIARSHWEAAATHDPNKTYHPTTLAQLSKLAPGLDWAAYFQAMGVKEPGTFNIAQPSQVKAFGELMRKTDPKVWQLYLKTRVLDAHADLLSKPLRDASFQLHGKVVLGQQEPTPRWQKSIGAMGGVLGESLGQLYVQQHFPPEHKAKMMVLVQNLMKAYQDSIQKLSWMTPATRQAAQDKLSRFTIKIGYPDQWRSHDGLQMKADDAVGNARRLAAFEWQRGAGRIQQPVDRSEWEMTPQTVNAYYNPSMNEIVFPAAILQAPFFDPSADDAVNYGAIGGIIGHEISHGFDNSGAEFDGEGRLRNWWTPADRKAFQKLCADLVKQYGQYEVLPGKKLNGQLTLGENIADLSGLQMAFKAYQLSLGGQPAPKIEGYTGEQRFFLGWAQAWREKVRDERALQLLSTDPHSPTRFRADGAVVNHDGFHQAFGTKEGDGLYKKPGQRIRIW